jgi:hypothetical protein
MTCFAWLVLFSFIIYLLYYFNLLNIFNLFFHFFQDVDIAVFEEFNEIPNSGTALFRIGDDDASGRFKKKEGFIRFKGLWELISVRRLIERYVMCVIFNITEEGHITLDIQKCM